MNTSTQSHALPLIPPVGNTMTMAQCDAEIKSLRATHCDAITAFWKGLQSAETPPSANWTPIQNDLHRLYHFRDKAAHACGFDAPSHDNISDLWNAAISQLDEDIQKKLQMPHYASAELVAIATEDDDLTLVHRYEGPELHGLDEDALDVANDDGPNWYYRPYYFESDRFERGAYSVPCLYVIGTVDRETGEWIPKSPDHDHLWKIRDLVEDMESLVDRNALNAHKETPIPSFPSGVQSRLQELKMLRVWMSRKAVTKTDDEQTAVKTAGDPFVKPIDDLREQIESLHLRLESQEKLKAKAELEARLRFFGFEIGNVVSHASSGETGILAITEGRQPKIFLNIDGQTSPSWSTQREFERQMRCGEWALANKEDESPTIARERG